MKPIKAHKLGKLENFASVSETREAIKNLTKVDYAKLMLIARSFAWTRIRGTVVQPDDLLHDAIYKTLDGRRRWNKSVDIIKHLDRVMESDSGHITEKNVSHGSDPIQESPNDPIAQIPDPEALVIAQAELEQLLDLFVGDEIALGLLRLKGDGFSAIEIQCELKIDKTQYETITKRIRRRLVKRLSEQGSQP